MARVCLVVPCYNEEERFERESFRDFTLADHELQFCFVNDGSLDGTLSLLEQLGRECGERVRVMDLPVNSGKAEAVRQGVLASLDADFIGYWDADLATPLAELPRFVHALQEDPLREIVVGSRVKLMGRDIQRKPVRHYLGRVFATAVSLALSLPIYDTQCGAKLFRRTPAFREVFAEPFVARWIFDVEILSRYLQRWRRTGEVEPASAIYELPLRRWIDVPGSKLQASDFLHAIRDLWRIRARHLRG